MTKKRERPADLREACIQEALAIIDAEGVEELSLRDVARRLGVSHQAPYKHFQSRDHILAEIVARAFASFARYLNGQPQSEDPHADLMAMSSAYLRYAKEHPLQYRLMFGTPLPDTEEHPHMMVQARHAFSLLCEALRRRSVSGKGTEDSAGSEAAVLLDALFIWSALHGLSGISSGCTLQELGMPTGVIDKAAPHMLERIGSALGEPGTPPKRA
ncbi:MAG TPA: TetR/AcrR family transcriptional regulator [Kiloniellaceae bacterium]|nr:TetR/AcrR family transcriptional regulator [Kiloniellaceae bacterium]HIP80055.1 TetR/AcrR family transcriptional regulator [Kiloniellaceae bacterium]